MTYTKQDILAMLDTGDEKRRRIAVERGIVYLSLVGASHISIGRTGMYVEPNFKSKKALKEAVAKGETVTIFQPGPFGGNEPRDGRCAVEGPHFPKPHSWYGTVEVKDGRVVKVS